MLVALEILDRYAVFGVIEEIANQVVHDYYVFYFPACLSPGQNSQVLYAVSSLALTLVYYRAMIHSQPILEVSLVLLDRIDCGLCVRFFSTCEENQLKVVRQFS